MQIKRHGNCCPSGTQLRVVLLVQESQVSQPLLFPTASNGFSVCLVLLSQVQATLLLPGEWPLSKVSWPFSAFVSRPFKGTHLHKQANIVTQQISTTASRRVRGQVSVHPDTQVCTLCRRQGRGEMRQLERTEDQSLCLGIIEVDCSSTKTSSSQFEKCQKLCLFL